MQRYLERLPDARLITLRNAGHCPQLELPRRVAKEILEFTQ
jgi:pimeloyl-ACP methyl ester carboxylesterase